MYKYLPFPIIRREGNCVKAQIQYIRTHLRQPWLLAVLCIAVIPIFPEYISIPLAGCSIWAAAYDAKARRQSLFIGTLGKLLLVFIAYMAVGVFYSDNPLNSLSTLAMWVIMFLVYLAMTTVLCNKQRFDTALFCIALVAGIVGLISCFQYGLNLVLSSHVPQQFWGWIDRVVYQWFPMPLNLNDFGSRVSSTFTNPNIVAEYLVMVLPFVIYYAFSGKRTRVRILCRVCLLTAVGGIAFSFSRGSYLALLCMVLVLCVANIRKLSVIIMSAVSLLVLVPDSVMERFFSVGSMDHSISERWSIWGVTLKGILENPIFGRGPGIQNTWDMLVEAGVNAPHAHNLVLELLVEGGIIALFIMMLIGWKVLRTGIHLLGNQEVSFMGVTLIAFVLAFIMHGMVDFPLLCPKLVGTFMMVIAFTDVASRLYLGQRNADLSTMAPTSLRRRRLASDSVAMSSLSK